MIHHLISYIITPSTNSMCGLSPLSCFSSWKWLKISVGEFNKPQLFKVQLLIQQHRQVFVVCFSKASVEAAHKKWNYQEVCGVVDEKQDKPDSSKLQHVQCTRCHSQTSAREQAPFIQTPSVRVSLHDRLHTWGMAKAACSWMLFPIVWGGWMQTSTCPICIDPLHAHFTAVCISQTSTCTLSSISRLPVHSSVFETVSVSHVFQFPETLHFAPRNKYIALALNNIITLHSNTEWIMPSHLERKGWEEHVYLHPPRTIGNSIQLQTALAIPQLYSEDLAPLACPLHVCSFSWFWSH